MNQIQNNKQNTKPYDLEERTFQFAKAVRMFVKTLSNSIANNEDSKQLVRASGSVGANYIEANESLGKKDFLMRIKIYKNFYKKLCRLISYSFIEKISIDVFRRI